MSASSASLGGDSASAGLSEKPAARVLALCGRDEDRARARLDRAGIDVGEARFTTRYHDLLASPDIDIISIATPFGDVRFEETQTPTGAAAIRVLTQMPGSADVSHHPFQGKSTSSSHAFSRTARPI